MFWSTLYSPIQSSEVPIRIAPLTIAVCGGCRYDFPVIRSAQRTCLSASKGQPGTPSGTVVMLLCALLSGCAHLVKVSYAPAAVIHPAFDQPTMNWEGERVQIVLTPSLQGETLKYLANNEKVFLANSLRQRGFRHVYKINGQGTPLVVY